MRSYNPCSQFLATGSAGKQHLLHVFHVLRSHPSKFLAQSGQDLDLCGAGNSIVHADINLLLRALLRQGNLPAFLNAAMKNQLPIKLNKYFIKNICHTELNPIAVKYKRGFHADFH